TLENLMRIGKAFKSGKIVDYLSSNISEVLYFAASIIIIPLSFFFPALLLFRWVTILKFPNVCKRFNDEKVYNVIVRIIMGTLIFFFVFPFLNVIAVSFSSPGETVNILPKGFDLFSVQYVLQDMAFYKSILVSIFVTVTGTIISVICMAMAAYPLSKPDMPFRKTMMMFFIIVMLFSGGMAPNILLVNALHLSNTIWALIFPSVVNVFHLLLLKGFFESIPLELEESAKLDGAKNYTILFKIIIPVAAPMIATVAFFTAITYWNNINNSILYITSNQDIYPLPMYIKNFLGRNPMDIAQSQPELLAYWDNIKMSYIMLSIIPIAAIYPLIFKYLKNGVASGAVKG
ncbi:MAG: carbohydrate ABC transporter permease, partial [Oscillospiraceae bacterium]